jgi:glycosyltransferase involved in cell wall biosynthesis
VGPSFSVVIPTAGRPTYLEGCLAALAGLDPPEDGFEVVVVNDGGGEPIERVVSAAPASLDARVARPDGTGPSAARNAGAAAARGRVIAFTDDDCEPRPGWLVALEAALDANPGAAAGGRTVNGAPGSRGAVASQIVVDALHSQFNREPGSPRFFASSNIAMPRDRFLAVGGFDEGFRYAEDREFCERWLRRGGHFVAAPSAVVVHVRTLSPGEFWRQHHGYGRGAWAFGRQRPEDERRSDTSGVLRALLGELRRARPDGGRLPLAAYLALSQIATATGYLREAVSRSARRPRTPPPAP